MHDEMWMAHDSLGNVYRRQGNFGAAIEAHEKAIAILEDVEGREITVARLRMGLGEIRKGGSSESLGGSFQIGVYTIPNACTVS